MNTLKEELLHVFDKLNHNQQAQLLELAKRLDMTPEGTSGDVLIAHMSHFQFDPDDLATMMRVIEER